MRAPSDKRSTDKQIGAIEEACRCLRSLFADVVSWNERGADTISPKKKFKATIALVENALGGAKYALDEALKCALNKEAADTIANTIPFIELARKVAIPELRQARPPKGRWGHHSDLSASRNRTIAETVRSIRKQFGLSQEQASSVVSEALKSLVKEHRRAFRGLTKERSDDPACIPADPAWIDEGLKIIDKLCLSEDRVEDIAKKY
jgi:hypothetical protein